MVNRLKKCYNVLSITALLLLVISLNHTFAQTSSTDWMRHTKFGIMVHYLEQLQNGTPPLNMGKVTSWDSCVNDFDVHRFASQLNQLHAGYVIFTLFQGSRFICTPNVLFEKATGYARGQATSHRDLIMDLSNALQKYNIKLILYVTADGLFKDDKSNRVFQSPMLQYKQNGDKFIATDTFANNWAAVLREWSMRYKKRISGWWVDGAYKTHGYNDDLLERFYKALMAGNPNSIIAFNNAVHPKIETYSKWDSYTAGEMNGFDDLPPTGGKLDGKQWHILSFLGTDWASTAVKYNSPTYLIGYINRVNAQGGVATINVAVYRNGSIAPDQLAFLKQLNLGINSR